MTDMPDRARFFWARTRAHLWPDPCVLVRLPPAAAGEAARLAARAPFGAFVLDRDEGSLTVPQDVWRESALRGEEFDVQGPFRAITLDVVIPLDVTGYLAPLLARLAQAGIAVIPQCGFSRDHILVHEADAARAQTLVENLIAWAAGSAPDPS